MFVCVHTNTYAHTCTQGENIQTQTRKRINLHTNVHAQIYKYMHTHMYAYIHTYVHIHTGVHTCAQRNRKVRSLIKG